MTEDTVVQLRQPGTYLEDPPTEILRLGARRLLAQAVEIEATAFVEEHAVVVCAAAAHRDLLDQVLIRRYSARLLGPAGMVSFGRRHLGCSHIGRGNAAPAQLPLSAVTYSIFFRRSASRKS